MSVLELSPSDIGTPLPIDKGVPADTYTYDYIIVGGGTSGCVLASRLSEDPNVSVLVIERGPVADTWLSRIPLMSSNVYGAGGIAQRWWSLPLREADNRFVEVMRGEGLGGTSRINGHLYTRGSPGDYNQWRALGNDGWGYEDLEPYFVRSEDTGTHPASTFRGKGGVWYNQQFTTTPYKVSSYVDHAITTLGIPKVTDVNAPDTPAACTAYLDVIVDRSAQRLSTYRAFLPPALTRKRQSRLKICTNATVTRVQFSAADGDVTADGVHLEASNARLAKQRYYAMARREVILCGGALGSPQILMLSGIGPREHLREKGISVVKDLPAVGSHLQDHIGVPIAFEVPLSDSIHELQVHPLKAVIEFAKYIVTGGGIFGRPFQTSSTFVATRLLDDNCTIAAATPAELDTSIPENRPDIEFMHIANSCSDTDDTPGKGIYTLLLTLLLPKSQGSVRLATMNPRARPDVDLGFLTHPADYAPLRKGVRLALQIGEEVRRQGYQFEEMTVPKGPSDEDIDRFLRANIRTCFHYTSTCRMGVEEGGALPSVVDAELKVHGVRRLRVCDASIFPEIIGSHTMAPAVVVAEKLADMLRSEPK